MRERPVLRGREVLNTGTPCPLCLAEGNWTFGGTTPTLRHLPGQEDRPFCLGRHGYITPEELACS